MGEILTERCRGCKLRILNKLRFANPCRAAGAAARPRQDGLCVRPLDT